jgi:hypothetical protein
VTRSAPRTPRRPRSREVEVARDPLRTLYWVLPEIACRGLCHEACGPIAASPLEIARLEAASGRTLGVDENLTCSMLTPAKRCVAYEDRPMICRLFGLVKKLRCPHGCVPSRWLSDTDASDALRRAQIISDEAVVSLGAPRGGRGRG